MGPILTKDNLDQYLDWNDCPWGAADLLYERLPMLTIRNYISCEDDATWPLCWMPGVGLRRGLTLCIDFLRAWQAFRPVAARTIQKRLTAEVPGQVLRVQRAIRDRLKVRSIQRVNGGKADTLVNVMADAVAAVSACKDPERRNPMLGSKVMHFFFPEFFPVWDTAYVEAGLRWLEQKGAIELVSGSNMPTPPTHCSPAAATYAQYVRLLIAELRAQAASLEQVGDHFIERATRDYHDKSLRVMVEHNVADLTPILFELCLIGYARKEGAFS
jgi:hypothetical protein